MVNKIVKAPTDNELIQKVNEVIDNLVTVDSALSTTSENPVQNKVITAIIGDIETALNTINSGSDSE